MDRLERQPLVTKLAVETLHVASLSKTVWLLNIVLMPRRTCQSRTVVAVNSAVCAANGTRRGGLHRSTWRLLKDGEHIRCVRLIHASEDAM
jgi:hypothetical protein